MSADTDRALLQRFEPIIRYTRGERFFPMDAARYVETCNLWIKRPGAPQPTCLIDRENLSLATLTENHEDEFGSIYFLKFADPLTAAELASYKLRTSLAPPDRADVFHSGRGRLARVGYLSRFAHALFLLSLLARGRVPGDAAAAASITYESILSEGETHRYYGRVIRENGWIVLQYWFFYAFNNWRSGFYGLNDHEADWEMICIYLWEDPEQDGVVPEWVAYATHDFSGDDLRRHWRDPELEKVGDHPIIYAGAGSHASYYSAGEYLVEVEIPYLASLKRVINQFRKFWREKLRQFHEEQLNPVEDVALNLFHLPFVDYARGDGIAIGPEQKNSWQPPCIISKPPPWISQYRGLWGMYVDDPLTSENAPGGPMYNRKGAVRRNWYDPLGWAGLDKIPPPNRALQRVQEQHAALAVRQAELLQMIEEQSHELTGIGIEAAAVQNHPHLKKVYKARQDQIKQLSQEIDQLRAEFAGNRSRLEAFHSYARQLKQGDSRPLRDHIRRISRPIPERELRMGRLMETWAAISIGLMLISLVILIRFVPQHWFGGIISIVMLFILIESTFHGRLIKLVTNVTIGLAVIAAVILLFDFFPEIAIVAALITGGYMMWQNLRELWS